MNTVSLKGQMTKHIKKSMGSKNPKLQYWYCGITNNEQRRKIEHSRLLPLLSYWKCLKADNIIEANEVELYFHNKGTSNRGSKNGARLSSVYVYVFRHSNLPFIKGLGLPGIQTFEDVLNELFG